MMMSVYIIMLEEDLSHFLFRQGELLCESFLCSLEKTEESGWKYFLIDGEWMMLSGCGGGNYFGGCFSFTCFFSGNLDDALHEKIYITSS
jgi:hypothetical protein